MFDNENIVFLYHGILQFNFVFYQINTFTFNGSSIFCICKDKDAVRLNFFLYKINSKFKINNRKVNNSLFFYQTIWNLMGKVQFEFVKTNYDFVLYKTNNFKTFTHSKTIYIRVITRNLVWDTS